MCTCEVDEYGRVYECVFEFPGKSKQNDIRKISSTNIRCAK